jgi:Tfp pilus assembly protein PilF
MIGHLYWWESNDRYWRETRSALEKVVEFPGGHPHHQSNAQNTIAHTYRHEGNYAVALEEFAKVLSMELAHPHHKSDAQLFIGITYFDLQVHDRAREELSKVKSMPGVNPDHVQRAQGYLGQIKV